MASAPRSQPSTPTPPPGKYTIGASGAEEGHSEWVSCVRFSPSAQNPLLVSCGWDKLVKVWNLSNCKLRTNLVGHTGYPPPPYILHPTSTPPKTT